MREIKFRCWHDNQMQKVSSIDFRHKQINLFASDIIDFDKGILMQYTNLKDKNGVEIYEGDLVKYKFGKFGEEIQAPVKFGSFNHSHCDEYNCEHYGWYLDYKWDNYCHNTGIDLYTISKVCEVIGNIYEVNNNE